MISRRDSRKTVLQMSIAVAVAMMLGMAMAASASADPLWRLDADANPTAAPGGTVEYTVQATNVGDLTTNSPFTLTIALPTGMTGVSAGGGNFSCPGAAGAQLIVCTNTKTIESHKFRLVSLKAAVGLGASGVLDTQFDLAGGGAPNMPSIVDPTTVTTDPPSFGASAFDGSVMDEGGAEYTQAGGHPSAVTTAIDITTAAHPANPLITSLWPVEAPKNMFVDLPPGFVGNPTATPRCPVADLSSDIANLGYPVCASATQVGSVILKTNPFGAFTSFVGPLAVYNLVPPPDAPASFGFNVLGTVVTLNARLRSEGDYGLSVDVSNVPEGLAVYSSSLTFWGDPTDSSHDSERACPAKAPPQLAANGVSCATDAASVAFLRNPTSCTEPGVGLPTTLSMDSWQNPGDFVSRTFVSHELPGYPLDPSEWGDPKGPTGCEQVPFSPTLDGRPTEGAKSGAPSGFSFDLALPQSDDPSVIGSADLKKAVVTLPEGVRVNPSSADGLVGCSSAQIALKGSGDPTCPSASKIGSLTIDTPLLDEQMTGGVYLAAPFDNPFGSLVAIYLVARGPGVVIKLPGQTSMDPRTGQITATFDDNPQLPFSNLHLELKGGPRAPLTLPKRCGTYATHAELTGWNGKTVPSDSSFTLTENPSGEPCPSTFTLGFGAGTQNPVAGDSSPFALRLTRDDEDQELSELTVDMPEGLTGKIANADLCAEGDAAAGTCGDGSKVGSVTVGAGAGTNPFYVTNGRAYLTGPYKGAPFGLSVVVPAVAGPFDLGNVVVRSALYVDRRTAKIKVVSDPFPTILQGIPLDVRDVRVAIDRPDFMINPTSCAEKAIGATVTSTEGTVANLSDRFQVGDCAALGFKPRLKINLRGGTKRSAYPALRAELNARPGDANIGRVSVALPHSEFLAQSHLGTTCTRVQFAAGAGFGAECPRGSVVGRARAFTPLLDEPLEGPVVLRSNGGERLLPDLVAALHGVVDVELEGHIDSKNGGIRTTFESVPDVPVSKFVLSMQGGKKGLLENSRNICKHSGRATVQMDGQNGKIHDFRPVLKARCGKAKKRGRQG